MRRMIVLSGIAVLLLVGGIISGLKPASASVYEYIKNLYVAVGDVPLVSGYTASSTHETVSGGYYEYRSMYYSTVSASGPWVEWTHCRLEGIVSGVETAHCILTIPYTSSPSTLYVRASTNFSGCGTWTPTPDEENCGGTMTKSYSWVPWS